MNPRVMTNPGAAASVAAFDAGAQTATQLQAGRNSAANVNVNVNTSQPYVASDTQTELSYEQKGKAPAVSLTALDDKLKMKYYPKFGISFSVKNPPEGQFCNFFTYKGWRDLNHNKVIEERELLGVGDPVNGDKDFYIVYSPGTLKRGKFIKFKFRIFDSTNTQLLETEEDLRESLYTIELKANFNSSVNAGLYKIVAEVRGDINKTDSIELRVLGEKVDASAEQISRAAEKYDAKNTPMLGIDPAGEID